MLFCGLCRIVNEHLPTPLTATSEQPPLFDGTTRFTHLFRFFFFFFLCHNYEKVKSWFYNLTIEIMNSTDVTHSTHQCFFFFWVGYSLSLVCLFLSDVHFLLFYLCPLFRILFLYLYFVCQNELGPFFFEGCTSLIHAHLHSVCGSSGTIRLFSSLFVLFVLIS